MKIREFTQSFSNHLKDWCTEQRDNTHIARLTPEKKTITILASEWNNKTVTKDIGIDSKFHVELGVPTSSDTTNLLNVSNAGIISTGHSGKNLTLTCLNSVPTTTVTLEIIGFTYSNEIATAADLSLLATKEELSSYALKTEIQDSYELPTATKDVLGGVKTTSTVTSTSGLTASPIIDGVVYYKDTNTTYGSMSASEATTGTATTARSISAKVLNDKIDSKISALVNSAPETLDTLNELASALGNDPNFATTVSTEIGKKLDTTTASSTYVAKSDGIVGLTVSGKVITYTKGDGSTGTITTQDTNTDTKVTNTLGNTTKAYITGTTSATTNTGTQIFDTGVYLTTTSGQLHADIDFPITEAQVNEILGIS